MWVLTTLVSIIPVCTFATDIYQANNKKCDDGWVRGEQGHCFYFSESSTTWADALFECLKRDAHLAIPETKKEAEFLQKTATSLSNCSYWLAGTDMFSEKKWIWWPTKKLIKDNNALWSPNQPDNFKNSQNCLVMWNRRNFLWDDQGCGVRNKFVCEKYKGAAELCQCYKKIIDIFDEFGVKI